MTTYTEMTEKATEQILAAVKPVNDLTKSFTDSTLDSVSKLPSLPRPEGVPSALEVVTAHFAFAEKLLAAQKDFAFKVAGAAATTKPKSSAKS